MNLWLRLNGDGILIAALLFVSALGFALDPYCLVEQPPCVPVVAVTIHGTYAVAGALLVWALWRGNVLVEVVARLLVVVSFSVHVLAEFLTSRAEVTDPLLEIAVVVTAVMRISALYQGGEIVLPRWGK